VRALTNLIRRVAIAFVVIVVALLVVQRLASERVEVVDLETVDDKGAIVGTRLWVVDYDGRQFLRAGSEDAEWYARVLKNPTITVQRGNVRTRYQGVPRPDLGATINELMRKKYTWGDDFFATVFGSRDGSVPIELRPVREQGVDDA